VAQFANGGAGRLKAPLHVDEPALVADVKPPVEASLTHVHVRGEPVIPNANAEVTLDWPICRSFTRAALPAGRQILPLISTCLGLRRKRRPKRAPWRAKAGALVVKKGAVASLAGCRNQFTEFDALLNNDLPEIVENRAISFDRIAGAERSVYGGAAKRNL